MNPCIVRKSVEGSGVTVQGVVLCGYHFNVPSSIVLLKPPEMLCQSTTSTLKGRSEFSRASFSRQSWSNSFFCRSRRRGKDRRRVLLSPTPLIRRPLPGIPVRIQLGFFLQFPCARLKYQSFFEVRVSSSLRASRAKSLAIMNTSSAVYSS